MSQPLFKFSPVFQDFEALVPIKSCLGKTLILVKRNVKKLNQYFELKSVKNWKKTSLLIQQLLCFIKNGIF